MMFVSLARVWGIVAMMFVNLVRLWSIVAMMFVSLASVWGIVDIFVSLTRLWGIVDMIFFSLARVWGIADMIFVSLARYGWSPAKVLRLWHVYLIFLMLGFAAKRAVTEPVYCVNKNLIKSTVSPIQPLFSSAFSTHTRLLKGRRGPH